MLNFHLLKQYLIYTLKARYWRGHGAHSPFVYDFIRKTLISRPKKYREIKRLVLSIKCNKQLIEIKEVGAGSAAFKTTKRRVGDIARKAGIRNKYGKALHCLVKYVEAKNVLELGTSVGISSVWMAYSNESTNVYTIEGNPEILNIAKNNFENAELKNIYTQCANFDDVLHQKLTEMDFDIVFIDGNHTYEATIKYFQILKHKLNNKCLVVFDDIYWSKGMTKAWKEIKKDKEVTISIDIFQLGIISFNTDLTRGDYIIRY